MPAIVVFLLLGGTAAWAGYVWVTGGDKFDFRRFTFRGPAKIEVYPVTGEVYFNGAPVDHGHVEAHAAEGEDAPTRMIGPINPDGTFEFYSEINSRLVKGLPAGRYKLRLIVYHPTAPLESPQPQLPDEYYDASRTPISVTVTSVPDQNRIVIKETGELRPKRERTRGGGDEAPPNDDDGQASPRVEAAESAGTPGT